jgi:hypothetical protein
MYMEIQLLKVKCYWKLDWNADPRSLMGTQWEHIDQRKKIPHLRLPPPPPLNVEPSH